MATSTAPSVHRAPDWRVAVGLSVIPGAGQLYNGQFVKALRLALGTAATIGGAFSVIWWAWNKGVEYFDNPAMFMLIATVSVFVFLGVFVYGLYLWASAVIDARESALTLAKGGDARRISFFHL